MNPATAWGCKGHRGFSTPKKQGEKKVLESLKAAPGSAPQDSQKKCFSHTVPCVPFEKKASSLQGKTQADQRLPATFS